MKKLNVLVAAAAIVFSTSSIVAQEATDLVSEVTAEVAANAGTYEAIEISELPEAVATAVNTDFAGATIAEAFKDEADNYKLVITAGEESKTVYTNAAGEWIEPND